MDYIILSYRLTRQDKWCHSSEVADIASTLRHLHGTTEGWCNDHRIYLLHHVDSSRTLHKIQRILSSSLDHMDLKKKHQMFAVSTNELIGFGVSLQ